MSRMLAGTAAFALMVVLALPGPAAATERRADGLHKNNSAMTEFSSQRRRWHRRHYARRHVWGPRRAYWGPRRYWAPRYAYYPYYRPRRVYAYSPYYYRPWRRPHYAYAGFPGVSFSIGFGPRYWW
jgi:hypothetical protein